LGLAKKHLHIFSTVGYHPHDAIDFDAEIVKKLQERKSSSIGENRIGLFRNLISIYSAA
jgi:Tat protein secretion system quality control protein TatD with DNase activity